MNLQHYYHFITIVEEGSLTAASKKLKIAQPALSVQLRALEERYNTRLFIRRARRLELTDTGIILFQKAKRILDLETQAKNQIANNFNNDNGTLCLGVTSSLATDKLFHVCTEFLKAYPNTNIKIEEADAEVLMDMLQRGKLEAILVHLPHGISDRMELLYKGRGELIALYAPDSGFFEGIAEERIPFDCMDNVPLSIVERSLEAAKSLFAERNMRFNVKSVSSRLTTAINWARIGQAVALVSKDLIKELGLEDLKFKTFTDRSLPIPPISLVAHKSQYRSPLTNCFLAMLSDVYGWDIASKLTPVQYKNQEEPNS